MVAGAWPRSSSVVFLHKELQAAKTPTQKTVLERQIGATGLSRRLRLPDRPPGLRAVRFGGLRPNEEEIAIVEGDR